MYIVDALESVDFLSIKNLCGKIRVWIIIWPEIFLELNLRKNIIIFPLGHPIFFYVDGDAPLLGILRFKLLFEWYYLLLCCLLLFYSLCLVLLPACSSDYIGRWVILGRPFFHAFCRVIRGRIQHSLVRGPTGLDFMHFLDGAVRCEDHSDVSFLANLRNLALKSTYEVLLWLVVWL